MAEDRYRLLRGVVLASLAASASAPAPGAEGSFEDFSGAVVVAPRDLGPRDQNAVRMLVEEIEERTRIRLTVAHEWPDATVPVVAVGPVSRLPEFGGPWAGPAGALDEQGYRLRTGRQGRAAPAAWVVGADSRGVLFGVGRLLREMRLAKDRIRLPDALDIRTAPAYRLRGLRCR